MLRRHAMRGAAAAVLAAALLSIPRAADADKNAFFRGLNDKPVAEFRDLVAVVHMLTRNAQEEKPFEQLRAELVVEGILPGDWTYKPESPVTKGMAAYGVVGALSKVREGEHGVTGGLTLMVTGNSERYALRECVYRGIVMPGYQGRYVKGGELLGILARAQAYRKTGKAQTLQLEEPPAADSEVPGPVQQERMKQQEAPK
jgi:hypothetical protein